MLTLVDEIRRLTAILAEYKALYFVQMKERELAGKQYVELQDELDKNKQVFHAACHTINILLIQKLISRLELDSRTLGPVNVGLLDFVKSVIIVICNISVLISCSDWSCNLIGIMARTCRKIVKMKLHVNSNKKLSHR